jgi:hypothetical protein
MATGQPGQARPKDGEDLLGGVEIIGTLEEEGDVVPMNQRVRSRQGMIALLGLPQIGQSSEDVGIVAGVANRTAAGEGQGPDGPVGLVGRGWLPAEVAVPLLVGHQRRGLVFRRAAGDALAVEHVEVPQDVELVPPSLGHLPDDSRIGTKAHVPLQTERNARIAPACSMRGLANPVPRAAKRSAGRVSTQVSTQ